jgi:hypothetical protein
MMMEKRNPPARNNISEKMKSTMKVLLVKLPSNNLKIRDKRVSDNPDKDYYLPYTAWLCAWAPVAWPRQELCSGKL